MRTIEADEAEARFNELLRDIESGNVFVVTRGSVPIALMTPARIDAERADLIIDEWERYRTEHRLTLGGGVNIRELIETEPA